MRSFENGIATLLILMAPVALFYSWFFNWKRMRVEPISWRGRSSLAALTFVSVVVLSWPVRGLLMPRADWSSGVGVGHQVRWAETWERAALCILLGAFVLGLAGRPRLIVPIVLACIGTALFWIFTTMP